MGLNNGLHNVPVRIEPGQSSLAPSRYNNNIWCDTTQRKSESFAFIRVENLVKCQKNFHDSQSIYWERPQRSFTTHVRHQPQLLNQSFNLNFC